MTRSDNPLLARRLLAGVLAAWLSGSGAQEVLYKWVDAAGVTHYAEQPPAGVAATPVRLPAPGPAPSAPAAQAAPRAAPTASAAPRQDAASLAQRLRECGRARQQRDAVTRVGPVFRYNDNGERAWLDDSARDAEIARLGSEVDERCAGVPEAQQVAAERQYAAEIAYLARCRAAQEALRELKADPRAAAQDLERAQDDVRRLCGAAR